MDKRVDELAARLRKGASKTAEILGGLSDEQWEMVLYEGPPSWTVRDLLAHFLSAEEGLLRIAQDIAAGGPGATEDFDEYNASEQARQVRETAGDDPKGLALGVGVNGGDFEPVLWRFPIPHFAQHVPPPQS